MDGRLRDKNVLFEFFTQFELNNYSRFLPIIIPYEYLSRFKIQSHLEITVISSNLDIEAGFPSISKKRKKETKYLAIAVVVYTSSLRWPTGVLTDSPFTLTS